MPDPVLPKYLTSLAIAFRSGVMSFSRSFEPPASNVNCPVSAPIRLPVIGMSKNVKPSLEHRAASLSVQAGERVAQVTRNCSGLALSKIPSSPNHTYWDDWSLAVTSNTKSACLAAALTEGAKVAPLATRSSALAADLFHTTVV